MSHKWEILQERDDAWYLLGQFLDWVQETHQEKKFETWQKKNRYFEEEPEKDTPTRRAKGWKEERK